MPVTEIANSLGALLGESDDGFLGGGIQFGEPAPQALNHIEPGVVSPLNGTRREPKTGGIANRHQLLGQVGAKAPKLADDLEAQRIGPRSATAALGRIVEGIDAPRLRRRLTTSKGILMPTFSNGKICYIEIPATDIARSAGFYELVFGWSIRKRGDGSTAFDDTVGGVSGTWVLARPPASTPGLLVYIMVESASATVDAIIANGGEMVQPIGADAPQITARFLDPAGNVIGIYQESA